MLFAISYSLAQAVEVAEHVAATSSTKYVLIDSGATTTCATTNCASEQCFTNAAIDSTRRKELWAINGTPIQHKGELTECIKLRLQCGNGCGQTGIRHSGIHRGFGVGLLDCISRHPLGWHEH